MTSQDHFVGERQAIILAQLNANGRVSAQDLAQTFGVSEDTVRRDLREMAARGECERVYGGALKPDHPVVPLKVRIGRTPDRKALLGQAAAALLLEDTVVFIDAGSTNLAIARHIPANLRLTVVTNTPVIAAELAERPGIELVLVGGRVHPVVGAAIDATALRQLEQVRPDLCILGACGITLENGLAADIYEDAVFKRIVCAASASTMAAITTEKLGHRSAFQVLDPARPISLVLEHGADSNFVDVLVNRGLDIHHAAPCAVMPASS